MTTKEELFFGNLTNEIIARACKDYAMAYLGQKIPDEHCRRDYKDKGFAKVLAKYEERVGHTIQQGSPEHTKLEVEYFFQSDWFRDLTGGKIDSDRLLKETVISTIDDVLAVLSKAFEFQNHTQLRLLIETPKGEENVSYLLPPKIADKCYNAIRRSMKDLKKEAAELSEGHTAMVKRKVLNR